MKESCISLREIAVNVCISLREIAVNVNNFEKKKMLPLTEEELKLHQDFTIRYICRKTFTQKLASEKSH